MDFLSSDLVICEMVGVLETLAGVTDVGIVREGIRAAVFCADKDCLLFRSGSSNIKHRIHTAEGTERWVVACFEDHRLELWR